MNITLENCYSVMLAEGNKHETVKERKKIEELLKKQNVPLFEKIIEAQIKYAGVSYCKYEKDEDEAYRLDLFNDEDIKGEFALNSFWEPKDSENRYWIDPLDKNRYYFHFIENETHNEQGPFICDKGNIYEFCMGNLYKSADSIEEYLDDAGIHFYLFRSKPNWFIGSLNEEEFKKIQNKISLKNLKTKHITNKNMLWLTNEDETLIIRRQLEYEGFSNLNNRINIFCENMDLLVSLKEKEIVKARTVKEYYKQFPEW